MACKTAVEENLNYSSLHLIPFAMKFIASKKLPSWSRLI